MTKSVVGPEYQVGEASPLSERVFIGAGMRQFEMGNCSPFSSSIRGSSVTVHLG